jgi:hypothetical protein
MLEIHAVKFIEALNDLSAIYWICRSPGAIPERSQMHPDSVLTIDEIPREHAGHLFKVLTDLKLPVSAAAAERLVDLFKSDRAKLTHVEDGIRSIQSRMRDELKSRAFLAVRSDNVSFFEEPKHLLGQDVWTKYRSAHYDIEEAGKCFALARYTASVFHLMRVVELAVNATRVCLGIPDSAKPSEKAWGKILGAIRTEKDKRNGAKSWKSPADADFFDGAYVLLDAVKEAWRDPTMHIESKYTEDEARRVFVAMNSFMSKLASRVDETGQPLA